MPRAYAVRNAVKWDGCNYTVFSKVLHDSKDLFQSEFGKVTNRKWCEMELARLEKLGRECIIREKCEVAYSNWKTPKRLVLMVKT